MISHNEISKFALFSLPNSDIAIAETCKVGNVLCDLTVGPPLSDDGLLCLSKWIRESRTLNKLAVILPVNSGAHSTSHIFSCLAASKSLVDVTICELKFDGDDSMMYKFIETSNVFSIKLELVTFISRVDVARLLQSLTHKTLHKFSVFPLSSTEVVSAAVEPQIIFDMLQKCWNLDFINLDAIDLHTPISSQTLTEVMRDNYTLTHFYSLNDEFSLRPKVVENHCYHCPAARFEAAALYHNTRFLSSVRPKKQGYRVPYEVLEHIFIYSFISHKYWHPFYLRAIIRVLSSKSSIGRIKNFDLNFSPQSLYYVCQKVAVLNG